MKKKTGKAFKVKEKRGQTFSLVHLIELFLGLLVLSFIGIGIISMVSGIRYYQEFYAKDTAYLIETLQAAPNGKINYGYLWSTPGYQLDVKRSLIVVNKTEGDGFGPIKLGPGVSKAYGVGEGTNVIEAALVPRYLYYRVGQFPDRSIVVSAGAVAQECTEAPQITGVGSIDFGSATANNIHATTTKTIIEEANKNLGLVGPPSVKIGVWYNIQFQPEIVVYDLRGSKTSLRISCLLEAQHTTGALSATRSHLGSLPSYIDPKDADIVIIASGQPQDKAQLEQAIINALSKYFDSTLNSATNAFTVQGVINSITGGNQ